MFVFGYLGFAAGGFLGFLFTVIYSSKISEGFFSFLLKTAGVTLLSSVIGLFIGILVDAIYWPARWANQPQVKFERIYSNLPLKNAACAGDQAKTSTLLSKKLSDETQDYLGYIVVDCVLPAKENMQSQPGSNAILRKLLPALHTLYLKKKPDPEQYVYYDYCGVLGHLIKKFDTTSLEQFLSLGLPLDCAGGTKSLDLEDMFNRNTLTNSESVSRAIGMINFLHKVQFPISSFRTKVDKSLLDLVVERGEPDLIVALLAVGVDPGHHPMSLHIAKSMEPSAIQLWTRRKFLDCQDCPKWDKRNGVGLTPDEITKVDAVMREPTTEEINRIVVRFGHSVTMLFYVAEEGHTKIRDSVALFRYLKARGADVGIASPSSKKGFLGDAHESSVELLAELAKLSPQEIDRMAHPIVPGLAELGKSAQSGEPLSVSAVKARNSELTAFLCDRQIDGCVPPWLQKEIEAKVEKKKFAKLEEKRLKKQLRLERVKRNHAECVRTYGRDSCGNPN
jgi:hypothetical protein